jgi:hypothetical protein
LVNYMVFVTHWDSPPFFASIFSGDRLLNSLPYLAPSRPRIVELLPQTILYNGTMAVAVGKNDMTASITAMKRVFSTPIVLMSSECPRCAGAAAARPGTGFPGTPPACT